MPHLDISDDAFREDAIDPADAWHAAGRFLATEHKGVVRFVLYEGDEDVHLLSRDQVLDALGRALEEGRAVGVGPAP